MPNDDFVDDLIAELALIGPDEEPGPISSSSQQEEQDFELEHDAALKKAEIEDRRLNQKERSDNIAARRQYARCIFGLLCVLTCPQ